MKKLLLALAFLLLPVQAALACLPFPVPCTNPATHDYCVIVEGTEIRFNFTTDTAAITGAGQAAEGEQFLQRAIDTTIPLHELRAVQDPDGWIDPKSTRLFHSDILGKPDVAAAAKTHITTHCASVDVEWSAVTDEYIVTWRNVP